MLANTKEFVEVLKNVQKMLKTVTKCSNYQENTQKMPQKDSHVTQNHAYEILKTLRKY